MLELLLALAMFITPKAAITSEGALEVSWKEAGLRPSSPFTYRASADGLALYWCMPEGAKIASGAHAISGISEVVQTFRSSSGGGVIGALELKPPARPNGVCGPKEDLVLVEVRFSDVKLSDGTTTVEIKGEYKVRLWPQ